jgi:glucokinase
MAGELGHIRLSDFGPVGYGKMGSFEGFCSGGGIAQLAKSIVMRELQMEKKPVLSTSFYDLDSITAEKVGLAAKEGDELALEILKIVGIQLGKGLSILIDLLNPEKIIIGSIFVRCFDEIWPWAEQVIKIETLSLNRKVCQVVPSQLSEAVGDIASLTVAEYYMNMEKNR